MNSFLSAILCCVLFGFGIGGVAAFMNVIFAESMGIETIQVRTNVIQKNLLFCCILGHNRSDVSFYWPLDASDFAYYWFAKV